MGRKEKKESAGGAAHQLYMKRLLLARSQSMHVWSAIVRRWLAPGEPSGFLPPPVALLPRASAAAAAPPPSPSSLAVSALVSMARALLTLLLALVALLALGAGVAVAVALAAALAVALAAALLTTASQGSTQAPESSTESREALPTAATESRESGMSGRAREGKAARGTE